MSIQSLAYVQVMWPSKWNHATLLPLFNKRKKKPITATFQICFSPIWPIDSLNHLSFSFINLQLILQMVLLRSDRERSWKKQKAAGEVWWREGEIWTKRESRRQQLGQMLRNYSKDKRHKSGLQRAAEIEHLITSRKKQHNEIVHHTRCLLCCHPALLHPPHTHTQVGQHTHTSIYPKELKKQRWSSHFELLKLNFIPLLTLCTPS